MVMHVKPPKPIEYDVVFHAKDIGIKLNAMPEDTLAHVSHFSSQVVLEKVGGQPQHRLEVGDALIGMNGVSVEGEKWGNVAKKLIRTTKRPLQLRFRQAAAAAQKATEEEAAAAQRSPLQADAAKVDVDASRTPHTPRSGTGGLFGLNARSKGKKVTHGEVYSKIPSEKSLDLEMEVAVKDNSLEL